MKEQISVKWWTTRENQKSQSKNRSQKNKKRILWKVRWREGNDINYLKRRGILKCKLNKNETMEKHFRRLSQEI
jgi:hypothetical protein